MPSAVTVMRRTNWFVGCLLPLLFAALAPAQSIDVSLNVFYTNPASVNSGGTWELVAKSSHSGIAGVSVLLTNITTAQNEGARGMVNGSDPAGFSQFFNEFYNTFDPMGFRNVTISQAPIPPISVGAGEEQSVFYGVGTLTNGAPNFSAKPPGTNSAGPVFASLTNLTDVGWATSEPFGDAAWDTAARLAGGTFAPGLVPGFSMGGTGFANTGNVFTTLGTSTTYGSIAEAAITTIIRTNLSGPLLPDYNDNGFVDAADYVLWRDTFGQSGIGLPADGNNNGIIDQDDYNLWCANFGAVVGAGAATSAALGASSLAVPEPSTVVLFTLGGVILCRRRPRGSGSRKVELHFGKISAPVILAEKGSEQK